MLRTSFRYSESVFVVVNEAPIEKLKALARQEGRRFTSVEEVRKILTLLGNPQDQVRAIHVAGTNGKGSVCAMLTSMLVADGNTVGTTLSPHLVDITERCLINGRPCDRELFAASLERVFDAAASLNLEPGYFAVGMIASYLEFARQKLDWMVVEVGVGGRVDASNAMKAPAATVITSIAFDHTELLGKSLVEIALSKAGIARAGVPLFLGEMAEEAILAIQGEAQRVGARVMRVGEDFFFDENDEQVVFNKKFFNSTDRSVVTEAKKNISFSPTVLPLRGKFQVRNGALAIAVAVKLGVSEGAISEGLKRVRWPGRIEEFRFNCGDEGSVRVITDAAHNPAGMAEFRIFLHEELSKSDVRRVVLMISFLGRKDWRKMTKQLAEFALSFEQTQGVDFTFIATDSGNESALAPTTLAEALSEYGVARVKVVADAEAALRESARIAGKDGIVGIAGSIFLLGAIRKTLTDEEFTILV